MNIEQLLPRAEQAGSLLKARRETVAVAESSTGGLISAVLLAVPGASAYFLGSGVIYTRAASRAFLQIPDDALKGMRASTEPYALLNARTVRDKLGANWAIAETGATGPTGNRYGDAAGHSCIAVVGAAEHSLTIETGGADRTANMWAFTTGALDLLIECLHAAARPG
jgi:nicotinamide-nucleotide amidase